MTIYEFSLDKKREVMVQLAHHLGIDKPPPMPEDGTRASPDQLRRIARITLHFRDERGHPTKVTEWDKSELYGKQGLSMETLTHSIELAACRDAAFQFGGDCVYELAFHGEHDMNKSKFYFKIPGGQEVQHLAMSSNGHGGRNGFGGNEAGLAERLMPDILRYVQAKEELLERRSETLWNSVIKTNQHYASVITEYTDREAKIRQIELGAEDHLYEREKRRRDDDETAQMKRDAWNLVKDNAPKLAPYVLAAWQKIRRGPQSPPERPMQRPPQPGSPGYDPDYDAWASGGPTNGFHAPGAQVVDAQIVDQSEAWYGPENSAGPQGVAEEEPMLAGSVPRRSAQVSQVHEPPAAAPGALDKIRVRVALDTTKFVMLARGRKKLDAIRGALGEGSALKIFDEVVEAVESADLEVEADVTRVCDLSLAFGASVQTNPAAAVRLLEVTDNMTRVALVELSNLLKEYFDALQGES